MSLVCLSRVLLAQTDFEAAHIALARALEIQENVLGEDHLELMVTLELLTEVRQALVDLVGAGIARERARTISRSSVATTRRRLRAYVDSCR